MKVVLVELAGVVVDAGPQSDEVLPRVGIVGVDDALVDELVEGLEEFLGLEIEREATAVAEVPVSGDLIPAARAGDGRERFVFGIVADLDALRAGVGALVGLVAESSEVAGRVLGPSFATLAVLDAGRLQAALDEPARVRLPEVGRRDLLFDVGAVGGGLEVVQPGGVRRSLRRGELTPEPGRVVLTRGMVAEPVLQVRDRPDEVDAPFALLAVDVEADGVVAVEDVADAEVVEFAPAEPGLELDGDECLVPIVVARLDHGLDVVLDEEISLGRRRVEVVARPGRNPGEGLRRLVLFEPVATERAQGRPVVLVRVLVLVLGVDPADDRVCRGAIVERQPEEALLLEEGHDVVAGLDAGVGGLVVLLEVLDTRRLGQLGHPRGVPEDLEMAELTDLRREQPDVVAHPEQVLPVGLELHVALAGLEALAQCLDLVARVRVSHILSIYLWIVKVQARIRPLAYTKNPTIQRRSGRQARRWTLTRADESYFAIDTSPSSAGEQQGVVA